MPRRLFALTFIPFLMFGCDQPGPSSPHGHVPLEPKVHVRIRTAIKEIKLSGPDTAWLESREANASMAIKLPMTIKRVKPYGPSGSIWRLNHEGESIELRDVPLAIKSRSDKPLQIGKSRYAGYIGLIGDGEDRFDVVNHDVPLEVYVSGVIPKELYAHWDLNTYQANAIASRSYVLRRMIDRGRKSGFDVEATVTDQVYGGITDNPQALLAVHLTRGTVLKYEGKILEALFSGACGGCGQRINDAFTSGAAAPAPLNDVTPHAFCGPSNRANWRVERDPETLAKRIIAWWENKGYTANVDAVSYIIVTQRSEAGRPMKYTVGFKNGVRFDLTAEQLRHACNFAAPSLPKISARKDDDDRNDMLFSGFVDVAVTDDTVIICGRGSGHGVGLCQWGAQTMAVNNWSATDILQRFYPGATLARAY